MAKILLCVPVALGYSRVEFNLSTLLTIRHLERAGHEVLVEMDESGSIVRSRNLGAAKVILDKSFTHLMFLDSDMSWVEDYAMTEMVALNRGVVCGVYTTKWKMPRWTMMTYGDVRELVVQEDGCVELRKAPTGFMLIQREVLEVIVEERPDLKINFNSVVNRPDHPGGYHEPGQYLIFDARRSNEEDYYVSDDYGFSETWTGMGGKLWAWPNVTITHHFTTGHTANLNEYLTALGVKGLVALRPGEGRAGLGLGAG